MLEKLKQEAMRQGMKLLSNPKVMKMMADPRLMNAISQGFAIKGRIQSEIETRLRDVAGALNLATREDVESLRSTLDQMQQSVSHLERKLGQ
jgi:polyhydroxyalkanoate synthesis regulator phasin